MDNWAKELESVGGTIISKPKEFGKKYFGFALPIQMVIDFASLNMKGL